MANDAIPEGDETITLSLIVYSPSTATVGTPGSATITIHDPPPPVVSVERVNDAVEGETDGTFRFTRTGDLSQPLTVTYKVAETGPSLATPVDDYTPLTETVTFAAYASAVDVPVATTDDSTVEPDEVVMVTIAAASTYTIGTGAANVWIADDDGGLMIWVAASPGDWWEPSNWQANRAPEPNDHLYFIGSYSQQSMTSLGSLPLTYAGIHVASDYTGTVSLTAPVSVGTLEMAATGGTIDQPNGTGSALTVTSHFEWTGGTINASATASTVTVQAAVGELAPSGGGTVRTGSNISLTGGTVLTALAGTLQMLNSDLEFAVEENCGFAIDPGESGPEFTVEGLDVEYDNPHLRLGANAWAEVRSGAAGWFGRVTNGGGRLTLLANTSFHINGTDDIERAYVQWNGVTELYNQSTLTTGSDKEVYIQGGAFLVRSNFGFADATVTTALFTFRGANLAIGDAGNPHAYGTFRVNGDVLWLGGTYTAYVEGDVAQGRADRWVATGDFDCDGGILSTVVLDGEGEPVTPASEGQWCVVEGGAITKTALTYNSALWSLTEVGAPAVVTRWILTPQ